MTTSIEENAVRRTTFAMRCLVLAVSLVPAFAHAAGDAAGRLYGTWIAIKAERDGKPAADVIGHRLSFVGSRFELQSGDRKPLYAGTFRTDPAPKPGAIDFEHEDGSLNGKTWKGIYALDGDTLRICDNAPNLDRGRPTTFEAKPNSGYVSITFRRDKP